MQETATDKSTLVTAMALALRNFSASSTQEATMEQKIEEALEIERQDVMDVLELKWLKTEHALTAALARIDELTKELCRRKPTAEDRYTQEVTMNSLAIAVEDFNAESTHIQHDLAEYGEECNHDGALIQVDTPWSMGLVDEQGVPS